MELKQPLVRISFDEVLSLCQELTEKLVAVASDGWQLWGVPRNGLIIAGIMAHCSPQNPLGIRLSPPFTPSFVEHSTVVVDDIHDSGQTLMTYALRGMRTASLFWRKKDGHKPNFWVKTIEDDSCIVFPWEEEAQKYLKFIKSYSVKDET